MLSPNRLKIGRRIKDFQEEVELPCVIWHSRGISLAEPYLRRERENSSLHPPHFCPAKPFYYFPATKNPFKHRTRKWMSPCCVHSITHPTSPFSAYRSSIALVAFVVKLSSYSSSSTLCVCVCWSPIYPRNRENGDGEGEVNLMLLQWKRGQQQQQHVRRSQLQVKAAAAAAGNPYIQEGYERRGRGNLQGFAELIKRSAAADSAYYHPIFFSIDVCSSQGAMFFLFVGKRSGCCDKKKGFCSYPILHPPPN